MALEWVAMDVCKGWQCRNHKVSVQKRGRDAKKRWAGQVAIFKRVCIRGAVDSTSTSKGWLARLRSVWGGDTDSEAPEMDM